MSIDDIKLLFTLAMGILGVPFIVVLQYIAVTNHREHVEIQKEIIALEACSLNPKACSSRPNSSAKDEPAQKSMAPAENNK